MQPPNIEVNLLDVKNLDWGLTNLQLYQIQLSAFENEIPKLVPLLSPEEYSRANRYRFDKDKNRFIVSRGILKKVLSSISRYPVAEIMITVDQNRKPYLLNSPKLFFNISHTTDLTLIAIGTAAVGIDVEYINADFEYHSILLDSMNSQERHILANSANPRATFFKFWTRKEALVKATGLGIRDNFKNLKVLGDTAEFIDSIDRSQHHYRILSFVPKANYMASLAIPEGSKVDIPLNIRKITPKTHFH